jgi:hypothetical protein
METGRGEERGGLSEMDSLCVYSPVYCWKTTGEGACSLCTGRDERAGFELKGGRLFSEYHSTSIIQIILSG